MKSSEVFPFIQGLFADGTLPEGRNLWGYAYNIERYPEAIRAAERRGMDEYRLRFWLLEYARRCNPEEALMLPVIVRWGENERPQRRLVHVPMYSMKDFDSLPSAAEAALMLEVNAEAGQEVYMRDMRAPDVPDVWARIVVEGIEKEVWFNPLKMWRGEVKLSAEWYNLKDVQVMEWHVMGQDAEVPPPTDCVTRLHAERVHAGGNKHEEETKKISVWEHVGAALFLVILAFGLFCGIKRCNAPKPPREPASAVELYEGQQVPMAASIPSGHVVWQDLARMRRVDELFESDSESDREKAIKMMVEAENNGNARRIHGGTVVTVRKVAARPNAEGFYYVQIQYGGRCWWVEEVQLDL